MFKLESLPGSLWLALLAASGLALAAGIYFLPFKGVFNVLMGIGAAFMLIYFIGRMTAKALKNGVPGKSLIIKTILRFYLRFLLSAAVLAVLAYLNWLHPLGFLLGFSSLVLAMPAWGAGWIIKNNRRLS
ncbi:MAG: hypothetical protein LBJ14_00770 [Desulfarculales bacterium]|jgi:hypothetical protein|nr:hypothetical protein [Desulfarculales bacterium]